MTKGIRIALIGCAALMGATPAQASASVKRGLYDCYSFSTSIGNTTYQGSVSLKTQGRYAQAAGRHGRSLIKPRVGKYKQAGSKITFSNGPWADLYGVQRGATRFDVWAKGENIKSWTCYFKS
jgi:hypothetical protein